MNAKREGVTERRDLTPLSEKDAEALRQSVYHDIKPVKAEGEPHSHHIIETELFGCSIVGEEIRCSFRFKGRIYRPEARAKTNDEGYVINIAIPATVERRDAATQEGGS